MRRSSRGNPYHDRLGRFTTANGCLSISELSEAEYALRSETRFALLSYESEIEGADERTLDDITDRMMSDSRLSVKDFFALYKKAQFRERDLKRREALVWVDGKEKTGEFIEWYISEYPTVKKEIPKYRGILSKIKEYNKAEYGTYDILTGKKTELNGYSVTFHQNSPEGYTDEEYAAMCAISKRELGSDSVYINCYGKPEVGFICKSKSLAMDFAVKHNQQSIYDSEKDETIPNKYWSRETNPIK